MLQSRLLVTLMVCLWYALQGVMFIIIRPELAYSYGYWLHGLGDNLPGLTATLSLAVLGPEISSANQGYDPVFWLVWGGLLLPPPVPPLRPEGFVSSSWSSPPPFGFVFVLFLLRW